MPGATVRQFSYAGLGANGMPLRSGGSADDVPLPLLGDRMAQQLLKLHQVSGRPVDVVAESEGTLGVYAMLDRHPGLPIGSVVLLSPIVEPGQLSYPSGQDAASVSEYALDTLNHLVGGMSPYGPGGAEHLISSVSEFGASYFSAVTGPNGKDIRWLAVVPLADAVTLPVCELPRRGCGARVPRRPARRRHRPADGQRVPDRTPGPAARPGRGQSARRRGSDHRRRHGVAHARHAFRVPLIRATLSLDASFAKPSVVVPPVGGA